MTFVLCLINTLLFVTFSFFSYYFHQCKYNICVNCFSVGVMFRIWNLLLYILNVDVNWNCNEKWWHEHERKPKGKCNKYKWREIRKIKWCWTCCDNVSGSKCNGLELCVLWCDEVQVEKATWRRLDSVCCIRLFEFTF